MIRDRIWNRFVAFRVGWVKKQDALKIEQENRIAATLVGNQQANNDSQSSSSTIPHMNTGIKKKNTGKVGRPPAKANAIKLKRGRPRKPQLPKRPRSCPPKKASKSIEINHVY